MATKIRLQRFGRKGKPFFHVVAADSRSPRDGKFIEKLGTYNPTSNPATIEIDFDRCLYWVSVGAQPTDTTKAILSYKGVLMKDHLDRGVKKGAFTQEQAEAKFAKWLDEKVGKVQSKKDNLKKAKEADYKSRQKAEAARKEEIAKRVLAKNTPVVEEAIVEAPTAEEQAPEAAAE